MAAGNAVNVTITATDRVTAKVDAINKKLAAMRAPAEKLSASLAKFGKLSGLASIGTGFKRIGGFAKDAFLQVSRIITPLAAITGAASLAGMYRLTEQWASFGSQLGFASQRIGLSSDSLQGLDNAARLAGASAGSMQSGLQALGQHMWDAVGGRDPAFFAAMNRMHISWQKQGGAAKSVAAVLPQVADYIKGLRDPYAQAALATELFGSAGEELLPVLRLGSAGLADYQRKAAAYGLINQRGVDAANRLRYAQTGLTMAVEGLGYAIAEELEPVLTPLLKSLSDWIAKHRALIATKIHEFLDKVHDKAKQLWGEADHVAKSLGGWKAVAEDAKYGLEALFAVKMLTGIAKLGVGLRLAFLPFTLIGPALRLALSLLGKLGPALRLALSPLGLMGAVAGTAVGWALSRGAGQLPGAIWKSLSDTMGLTGLDLQVRQNVQRHQAPLTPVQLDRVSKEDIAAFRGMGWSKPQADIIEGNLMQESGLNPYRVNPKSGAFGLAQWLGPRVRQFEEVEGVKLLYSTRAQQRDFINWELHHTEGASGRLLGTLTDEKQADAFGSSYERYGAGEEGDRTRYAVGFAGIPELAGTDRRPPADVPARPGDGMTLAEVLIELHHKHPPPGTTVRIKSSNPAVKVAAVRTERAMDPALTEHGY